MHTESPREARHYSFNSCVDNKGAVIKLQLLTFAGDRQNLRRIDLSYFDV